MLPDVTLDGLSVFQNDLTLAGTLEDDIEDLVNMQNDAWNHRPLLGVPTNGTSRAVVTALRSLQDKIYSLETERGASKSKIRELEQELSKMRQLLFHEQSQLGRGVGGNVNSNGNGNGNVRGDMDLLEKLSKLVYF